MTELYLSIELEDLVSQGYSVYLVKGNLPSAESQQDTYAALSGILEERNSNE
jgi:hypothetical protein